MEAYLIIYNIKLHSLLLKQLATVGVVSRSLMIMAPLAVATTELADSFPFFDSCTGE